MVLHAVDLAFFIAFLFVITLEARFYFLLLVLHFYRPLVFRSFQLVLPGKNSVVWSRHASLMIERSIDNFDVENGFRSATLKKSIIFLNFAFFKTVRIVARILEASGNYVGWFRLSVKLLL